MSLYLDPDTDQTRDGPIFDLPIPLRVHSQPMHAAAVVIDRFGILLRGPSGSGKSLLQRYLRQQAGIRGQYAALVSDDYVQLARLPVCQKQTRIDEVSLSTQECESTQEFQSTLLAYGPVATRSLEEVRGLGVVSVAPEHAIDHAVMHLLVDLVEPDSTDRMPTKEHSLYDCLGHPIFRLVVPQKSAVVAADLIISRLSTWKDGC